MQECASPPAPTREEVLASPHLGVNLACFFRGCLENAVRKFYPRDLRLWPVLGGMRFEAKVTPSRLVVVVLRPHMLKVDVVGGRVTLMETDPPSPESAPQRVATPAGHRGLRKVFEVEDDGVVFLMPPLRLIAEDIQGLWNAWTPAERGDILAPQIVLNMDVQRRFLGLDTESRATGSPSPVMAPPGGWCGPGCDMKEAAVRLGFKDRRSLKSYLEHAKKTGRDPKRLADFLPGGSGRTPDGKFREDALAAYEAARERLPEVARAIAEGATDRAIRFGKAAARKLPLTALEHEFGRRSGR